MRQILSVFWTGIIIAIIALTAWSGFSIYKNIFAKGLRITISIPEEVNIGTPFAAIVHFENSSSAVMKDMSISLALPDNVAALGSPPQQRIVTQSIGDIGVGTLSKEEFELIIFGDANTVRLLEAHIQYESLNSRFEKSVRKEIAVQPSRFTLSVDAPKTVFNDENFETVISYKNTSDTILSDLELYVEFPANFKIKESTLKPTEGNAVWRLGELLRGSEGEITITGSLVGLDDVEFDIRAEVRAPFLGEVYAINETLAHVSLAPSPISIEILLNGKKEYIARVGDTLNYSFIYRNNTEIGLRDAVLRVQLIGEMFDMTAVQAKGSVNRVSNTITWSASNTPGLRTIPIGGSGSVNVAIGVKDIFSIARLNDKDFMLKVDARIESPTVRDSRVADRTVGIAKFESKIAGQTEIDARAYFRDAASGFLNEGPMPPQVGQPTQFSVHWIVRNYSTDIQTAIVRAGLPSNVQWINNSSSNDASKPRYDENTREVIWEIGGIPATRGVLSLPIEGVFQIEATPSESARGSYVPLLNDAILTAYDTFTNTIITDTAPRITTELPDDGTVGQGGGIVQ